MTLVETFFALLAFVQDLGYLTYALLIGRVRIHELWRRIIDAAAPSGIDDGTRSDVSFDPFSYMMPPQLARNVKHLPGNKLDVFKKHNCAVSGLCRAIVQRDVDLVKSILQAAPFLASMKHSLGYFPLVVAVLSGVPGIVEIVLTQPGVRADNKIELDDHSSSDSDDSEAPDPDDVELLRLEFSSNSNHKVIPDATALHYACMTSNASIIWRICRASSDFDSRDYHGKIPLDYLDSSSPQGIEALRMYTAAYEVWDRKRRAFDGASFFSAAEAIFRVDAELFKSILSRSPTITQKQEDISWTLLHVAVLNESMFFIDHIITNNRYTIDERGKGFESCAPYVNHIFSPFPSIDGATPLHLACLLGNFVVVDYLLKSHADWTIRDDAGRTPENYLRDSLGESYIETFKAMCVTAGVKGSQIGDGVQSSDNKDGRDGLDPPNEATGGSEDQKENAARAVDLEKTIGEKIVGQRGAVHSVASAVRLKENGWSDPFKPLVMLFLGSSGIGKTELAKQLALYMNGKIGADVNAESEVAVADMESDYNFVRIDMSEYQQSFAISNLIGSPKGYVGYDEGGFLTRKLNQNPNAVVLLDEIERAHPDILTAFLQLFDEGRITDSKYGVTYCENAIFIMTSNLASDEIKKAAPLLRKMADRASEQPGEYKRVVGNFNRRIHPVLKGAFKRDEFLGRINEIVIFLPLIKAEVCALVSKELKAWKKRAEENHRIDISWSYEVVEKIAHSFNTNFGARSVINEVTRTAILQVAEAQIQGNLEKNSLAYLTTNDSGNIELITESREGRVRERRGCRLHFY